MGTVRVLAQRAARETASGKKVSKETVSDIPDPDDRRPEKQQ
jgi:hypothetical protein